MKCPRCGVDNTDISISCRKCAAVFRTDQSSAWSLWHGKNGAPVDTGRPAFWAQPGDEQDPLLVLDDEVEQIAVTVDDAPATPLRRRANREKLSNIQSGRTMQVTLPQEPTAQTHKKRRVRINWGRFVVACVLLVALSGAIGYGGYMLFGALSAGISSFFSSQNATTADPTEPLVEKVLIDGESWHRITFYGREGEQIFVTEPRRTLSIENGKAELLINDSAYIPPDLTLDQDSVTVQLEAILFSVNGTETPLIIPPYTIDVPLSPLKLISPTEQEFETDENRIVVTVKVTPGSRVIIGERNMTDQVNASGLVSASVSVEPIGSNTIPITVETKTYRKHVYELKVNRPVMQVPITLSSDVLSQSQTTGKTVHINGSTTPGAQILCENAADTIAVDGESGTFSFNAGLKTYGWNSITITAQHNGKSSSMTYRINRVPELDSYTKSAWELDYAYMSTAADLLVGRVYVFYGTVQRKLDDDTGSFYLFNTGSEADLKLLALEYAKESGLEEGKYYQIFADVLGTKDGYPLLAARFVYEKTPPGASTPAP